MFEARWAQHLQVSVSVHIFPIHKVNETRKWPPVVPSHGENKLLDPDRVVKYAGSENWLLYLLASLVFRETSTF